MRVYWFLVLAFLLPAIPGVADILTLINGDRREGMVRPAPGEPDAILFRDSRGEVKIPRNRIREIEEEPEEKSLVRIGDQFFARRGYQQALDTYRSALSIKPGDAEIQQRIERAETAIAATLTAERQAVLAQIDNHLARAGQLIEGKQFAAAETLLESTIPALEPNTRQAGELLELRKQLYRGWALDRNDKLDRESAAVHFEKLLRLDPTDRVAFDHLLQIWERMPDKRDQVIQAYVVRLQEDPEDQNTRLRLADKYFEIGELEKAAEAYQTLFDSGDFQRSTVHGRLVNTLNSLYRTAAAQSDYDTAIAYYKRLQTLSDRYDEPTLKQMEFWRDWIAAGVESIDARTSLALQAREDGLTDFARLRLEELRQREPENEAVLNGLRLYALDAIRQAQASWQAARYAETIAQANQVGQDYGYFPDIKEQATQLINLANVELLSQRRQNRELGMQYKRQADQYYNMGLGNLQDMRRTDVDRAVRVVSDRQSAIDNFRLAVQFYDQAVTNWTDMDAMTRREVQQNRNRAQGYLNQLTSGRPLPLPDTPRSISR